MEPLGTLIHVCVDPAIPPRSLVNEGDVMKTLTFAAVMLALVAGAAPVMAQAVQPPADGPMYNAYGQPNQVYGIPGAEQASASSHPAE